MGILPVPRSHKSILLKVKKEKSKKVKERLYVSILSLSVCHICHVV